jgi:hypothetical protein
MRQVTSVVRRRSVDVSTITTDMGVLTSIARDMMANAGDLLPIATWITTDPSTSKNDDAVATARSTFTEDEVRSRFDRMDKLVNAWTGPSATRVSRKALAQYRLVFQKHDPLRLWQANVEDPLVRATLRESDLASMLELQLLYSFSQRKAKTTIVEVGGGYGRLAEATFNVFGDSVRYVLIDAVPASIAYAKEYLTRACPDRRIGFHYSGDPFDLDRFDCYIVPAWRFEEPWNDLGVQADVCINVQSFQEMSQGHVDHYLQLFDRISAEGTVIMSINSREYLFQGTWSYPNHWRCVLAADLPRSVFYRSPTTEIFIKAKENFSLENSMIEACYGFSHVVARRLVNPIIVNAPATLTQRLRSKLQALKNK